MRENNYFPERLLGNLQGSSYLLEFKTSGLNIKN